MGSGPSEGESEHDTEGAERTRVDLISEVMFKLVVMAWHSSLYLCSQ